MHTIFIIGGFLTAATSIFFVIAAIADLIGGKSDTEPGVLIGLAVFFSFLTIGGFRTGITNIRKKKRKAREEKERTLLKLIAQKNGQITPFEVASDTTFSIEEAKAALDLLCEKGAGYAKVTEDGTLMYLFPSTGFNDD